VRIASQVLERPSESVALRVITFAPPKKGPVLRMADVIAIRIGGATLKKEMGRSNPRCRSWIGCLDLDIQRWAKR
jgi:hypothetical protein